MNPNKPIYLSPPYVGNEERELLLSAFDSNWIAPLGPHVDGFEKDFVDYLGSGYACALSSGTAGLHLALDILNVGAGDTVFVSDFTFIGSVSAVIHRGASPVFIGSGADWNLCPGALQEALNDAETLPKAVIVVDLYGRCADYDAIKAVLAPHGIPIIQDAAEAVGASYKGIPSGLQGEIGVFSFNGNKIITTSGGGLLVSANKKHVDRARFLATQARDPAIHYEHSTVGYNYRMSNLLAALGRAQLRRLPEKLERRKEIFSRYKEAFAELTEVVPMPSVKNGVENYWLSCFVLPTQKQRDEVITGLQKRQIESRPLWKPMHLQPVFANHRYVGDSTSEHLFSHGLCLPSGDLLSEEDQTEIIAVVKEVVEQ